MTVTEQSSRGKTRTCDRTVNSRLLCQLSYAGSARDEHTTSHDSTLILPSNFHGKFIHEDNGCWTWTAAIGSRGYGSVCIGDSKTALAHRVAWESINGLIPDGLTIDHLCRNKRCVHPCHMEVVTGRLNTQRATDFYLGNNPVYPCGHPRTPENTRTKNRTGGGINRYCRECALELGRAWREKQRLLRIP